MVILIVLLLMSITYAVTFKHDFPIVLVKRTLVVLLVLLALKNIRFILFFISEMFKDIF